MTLRWLAEWPPHFACRGQPPLCAAIDRDAALNLTKDPRVSTGPDMVLGVGSSPVDRMVSRTIPRQQDECRYRPAPIVTDVRRDQRPSGQVSKGEGPDGQCKASVNPAAAASLSAANWQGN